MPFMAVTEPTSTPGWAINRQCSFGGIVVKTDGTNDITMSVYASSYVGSRELLPKNFTIPGSARLWTFGLNPPFLTTAGVYVDFTCAGDVMYQVIYDIG